MKTHRYQFWQERRLIGFDAPADGQPPVQDLSVLQLQQSVRPENREQVRRMAEGQAILEILQEDPASPNIEKLVKCWIAAVEGANTMLLSAIGRIDLTISDLRLKLCQEQRKVGIQPAKGAPPAEIREDTEGNYWIKNKKGMWDSYSNVSQGMKSSGGFANTHWGDSIMDERTKRILDTLEQKVPPGNESLTKSIPAEIKQGINRFNARCSWIQLRLVPGTTLRRDVEGKIVECESQTGNNLEIRFKKRPADLVIVDNLLDSLTHAVDFQYGIGGSSSDMNPTDTIDLRSLSPSQLKKAVSVIEQWETSV